MRTYIIFFVGLFLCAKSFGQTIIASGPTTFCAPGNVVLSVVPGAGITAYQWQRNNVDSAGATASTLTVIASGSYKVILSRTSGPDTTIGPLVVAVNPLPSVPAFTFATNNQCGSVPFNFDITSPSPGITYTWDFGDGTTGTGIQVNHIYNDINSIGNGTHAYSVSVVAKTAVGCTRQSALQTVSIKQKPSASLSDFNNNPAFTRCASTGSSIDFNLTVDNSSTTFGTNTYYEINWGDSTPSFSNASFPTTPSLPHTYSALGFFTLTHRVSGQNGCQNISKYTVYNGSNPGIGISSAGSTIQQCIPATDTFYIDTVRTRNNPPGTTYTVSFNDGSSDIIFVHPPPLFFVHTFSSSSCSAFGAINPNSFYVRIRAQNPCGFLDGGVEPITTVTPPVARFSILPDTVACINSVVNFLNTSLNGAVVSNGVCDNSSIINWEIIPASGWTVSSGSLGVSNPTNNPATWGSQNLGIIFNTAGSYSIKLIARNSANPGSPCRLDSIVRNVCITTAPTPGFTLDTIIGCIPFIVRVNNTTTSQNICRFPTYRWAVTYTPAFCGNSSAFIYTNGTSDTSANPSFSFTNPGTYTITQNVTNACGTFTAIKTVDVKKPPAVAINLPTYSCGVVTITPAATVAVCGTITPTYAWTFTGGTPATSATANPGSVTFTTVGTHPILLSVTNECGTTVATDSVVVTTAPDVVVPVDLSLCGGLIAGPFNFTSTIGTPGYTWTNSNPSIGIAASGIGNIPAFTAVNGGATPIISTIIVTPSVSNCTGTPDTFIVSVNPRPSAPAVTTPVPYCQNGTPAALAATSTGANTLIWYNNASLTGGTASAPTPSTATPGQTLYYVTQTNSFNCLSAPSVITIDVNPFINGNIIAASQNICAGTSPNPLNSGTVGGGTGIYTYQWQSLPDGSAVWGNINGATGSSYSPGILNDTIRYRRIVTSTPCADTSNTLTINVSGALTNYNIAASQIICEGFAPSIINGDLPTGGGGGYSYLWEASTDGNTWATVGGNTQNFQPPVLSVTTFYRRKVNASQCSATSNAIAITVNPTPTGSITAVNDSICVYDNGVVTFSATEGTPVFNIELVITRPDNTTDTIRQTINNNSPSNFTVVPVNSAAGNYTIRLTKLTDTKGCERTIIPPVVIITVKPLPVLVLTNSSPICNGVNASLTVSGATTYVWSPNTNINTTIGNIVSVTPLATTSYFVRGTLNGCFKDDSTLVTVIPGAVVADAGPHQVLCNAVSTTLAGNAASANATGAWSQVGGPVATISTVAQNNTNVTGLTAGGTYLFQWKITGQAPCPPTVDTVTIDVLSSIINTIKNDTIICHGQSVTIRNDSLLGGSSAAIDSLYSYQWELTPAGQNNWQIIAGADSAVFFASPSSSTCYRRKLKTNNRCESISNPVCIVVNPTIANNSIAASQQVCVNTPVTNFTGSTPSGGDAVYVYQWQTSTDSITWSTVANTVSYQPPTYTAPGLHYFIRNVTSGNCSDLSNVVTVRINPDANAIFSSATIDDCARFDLGTVISVIHLPDSNGTYNWYADNVLFGSNSTGMFPGYTIQIPGDTVIIKLITVSQFGCKPDTIQQQFTTKITASAQFTKDSAGGCGPLVVNFTNRSNLTGNSIEFFWDFGNGSSSRLMQPGPVSFIQSPFFSDTTYQVSLKAYNGCDTTIWRDSVTIRSNPKARFALDTTAGCSPFRVLVTNNSLGTPNTYYWNFGNGFDTVTTENGAFSYLYNIGNTVDTFPIRLIAVNECGSDTQIINVRIAPNIIRPQVTVSASELFGCAPHIVSFNNASTGATRFTWDFGDGSVPDVTNVSQRTVVHTYITPGIFTVAIQMTNGCSDTTVYRQVTVFAKPIAGFTPGTTVYCLGDVVSVNNTSQNASNYSWFWGDGQSSTGFNPTHMYSVAGNYTILLRAEKTNNSGIVCFDTIVKSIIVLVRPDTRVQSNINNINCAPFTVNASAPGIINELVTWYITDTTVSPSLSSSTGVNAEYTFNKPGTFSIKIVAENALGCKDSSIQAFTVRGTPEASFAPTTIAVCNIDTTVSYQNTTRFNDNGPLSYRWLVDDVQQSTNGNFTFRYASVNPVLPKIFTTKLIASNTVGCSDTATGTLTMFPNPKAQFSINNPNDCVPFVLSIANASQYTTKFTWLLNGVKVDTAAVPTISILQPSTYYTVELISENGYGCKPDTFSFTFRSRTKPKASFALNDTLGCTGILNVITTNNTSNASSYRWDWGDASPVSAFFNSTHLYNNLGQYRITLVASDGVCNDTVSRLISVANKPVVNFMADNPVACDTARVQFTNLTSNAHSYLWTFSDGFTSTAVEPYHLFAPGNTLYSVKLVASNIFGCKDSLIKANLIRAIAPPLANFVISPSPVISIPYYTFSFINTSLENIKYTYQWNLGDGTVASTRDAEHKYADTGSYNIRLIVLDNNTGCPDTLIKVARIEGQPGYLYVPNAFYPNSLQNQFRYFKPLGKGLETYQLQVFDAWGKLIFETRELDANGSPTTGWDGTFKGAPMQQDAYAWRIKATFRNGRQWDGMQYGSNNNGAPAHPFGTVTLFR